MTRLHPLLLAVLAACGSVHPESDRTPCDPAAPADPCPDGLVCLADDPLDVDAQHGSTTHGLCGVDDDLDGWRAALDCNDEDAEVHPRATEWCNGVDNDCDGIVDNDAADLQAWFVDADADGFGWLAGKTLACEAPEGHVANPEDCVDQDASIHPGVPELCDGVDNDCDDAVDEAAADRLETWKDRDGDGYGWGTPIRSCTVLPGEVLNDDDCNDWSAEEYPGNTSRDYPGDGIDNDCDGEEGPPCTDLDCDGYPDLWFPNGTSSGVQQSYIYYSSGSPGFDPVDHQTLESYRAFYAGEAIDLDGDGWLDIAQPVEKNGGDLTVDSKVFWGSHPGESWPPHTTADATDLPTHGALELCVADIDSDGDTDLFFPKNHYIGLEAWMYRNQGERSFTAESLGGFSDSSVCVLEDLTGDGFVDLVLSDFDGSTRMHLGDAQGPQRGVVQPLTGSRNQASWTGDIDGDGATDLLLAERYVGVHVFLGSTAGLSATPHVTFPGLGAAFTVADVDGDGQLDVIHDTAGGILRTQLDVAGGDPTVTADVPVPAQANFMVATDIDDDGSMDLTVALAGCGSGDPIVYWGSGGRTAPFASADTTRIGGLSNRFRVADLDLDGDLDIAFSYNSEFCSGAPGVAEVHWNDGDRFSSRDHTALPVDMARDVLVIGADCVNEACND